MPLRGSFLQSESVVQEPPVTRHMPPPVGTGHCESRLQAVTPSSHSPRPGQSSAVLHEVPVSTLHVPSETSGGRR